MKTPEQILAEIDRMGAQYIKSTSATDEGAAIALAILKGFILSDNSEPEKCEHDWEDEYSMLIDDDIENAKFQRTVCCKCGAVK